MPDVAEATTSTITAIDASSTDDRAADLLLSVHDQTNAGHLVYILVEQKSYHDDAVVFQLMGYLTEIWKRQWARRAERERGLVPVIHPVVLYHGEELWASSTALTELQQTSQTEPQSPSPTDGATYPVELRYRLIDLRQAEPLQYRVATRTLATIITLRAVACELRQSEVAFLRQELAGSNLDAHFRRRLLHYFERHARPDTFRAVLLEGPESRYTDVRSTTMTYTQMIQKETRKETREETIRLMAKRMIDQHGSIEFVCSVTGLSIAEVQTIAAQPESSEESLEGTNGNGH